MGRRPSRDAAGFPSGQSDGNLVHVNVGLLLATERLARRSAILQSLRNGVPMPFETLRKRQRADGGIVRSDARSAGVVAVNDTLKRPKASVRRVPVAPLAGRSRGDATSPAPSHALLRSLSLADAFRCRDTIPLEKPQISSVSAATIRSSAIAVSSN